jgi:nitrate/TMAO reductase-like tetraheme cytochrome c subunit
MPDKRIVQAGHVLALLFAALLLVGAHQYLGAHPVLAGLLLAVFAAPYYAAARVTGYRQFLYPCIWLLVLAYQLELHGAGLPLQFQPLAALVPVVLIGFAGVEALYAPNAAVIAVMSLWILFRLAWFDRLAPVAAGLALIGFAVYCWFRFRGTQRSTRALASVLLGSAGFLFLLYRYPAALAPRVVELPFGYLLLAAFWIALGLRLIRQEWPPLMGLAPARLPRLLPLFGAGVILGLAPMALFYPWRPAVVVVAWLAAFSLMFLTAARESARHAAGLAGAGISRLFEGLGRLGPLAALAYIATGRFPAAYRVAAAAFAIGLLSLWWAWLEQPKLLRRRNYFAYQAGVFFVLAYYLAERRLILSGIFEIQLASGALVVLGLFAAAWLLRNRLASPAQTSLYEAASTAAIAAALIFPLAHPIEWPSAILLGLPLLLVSGLAFQIAGEIATLFPIPVVFGFWLYAAEWLLGIRGEWLGIPYLVLGFGWAVLGYGLLRRASRWYALLYFMWFLSVGVSLLLFGPFEAAGAWCAPLWPLAFVLVARGDASRRDLPMAWALETSGALLAIGSAGVLLWNHSYAAASFAFLVYAALYAWVATQKRVWVYIYPSAFSAVAAFDLGLLGGGWANWSLPLFLPLAAAFYLLAILLRRGGEKRRAFPLELAATAGAVVGAVIMLRLPFGSLAITGWEAGFAYLVLYWLLARYGGEPVFFAGAGVAGAFALYEMLPLFAGVTPFNRLAFLIPAAWLLAWLGYRRSSAGERRGGWALYTAAITVAAGASLFVLWPMASAPAARIVLLGALAVWLALLIWTGREIFIYAATLVLAMLAYHFVQNSSDLFGRHLVSFFLWGSALVGLVFLAAMLRNVVRFRRPALFLSSPNWRYRYLYVFPVGLLGLAIFGAWGVETSSNPIFCGSCHEMRAYYGNWHGSLHAKSEIACSACHYEPGLRGYAKAKIQGVSQLVISLTGTASPKPSARVNDENCLRAGCHSIGELLTTRHPGGVYYFNHASHLRATFTEAGSPAAAKPWRGPDLRCTSCHTDVGPESHFAVDTNSCFTCHFEGANELRPAVAAVGCSACHQVPQRAARFDHVAAGVSPNDAECAGCHASITTGSPAVEERRCRHCHLERPTELLHAGAQAIHTEHVRAQGIACDWCHDEVRHQLAPQTVAAAPPATGGN